MKRACEGDQRDNHTFGDEFFPASTSLVGPEVAKLHRNDAFVRRRSL
jgi:hypothetical protein